LYEVFGSRHRFNFSREQSGAGILCDSVFHQYRAFVSSGRQTRLDISERHCQPLLQFCVMSEELNKTVDS
jgi:hypothetical protein